ncbi:hypothetical protein PENTCL1PPCAC_20462, partial [Pristionchus entomophagus]
MGTLKSTPLVMLLSARRIADPCIKLDREKNSIISIPSPILTVDLGPATTEGISEQRNAFDNRSPES